MRTLDTLMLLGVVKIDAIYHQPEGATLASNLVSEVAIGNAYTIAALAGSATLLRSSSRGGGGGGGGEEEGGYLQMGE